MANTIQIKRGNSEPPEGTLQDGELGFDKANDQLYIGNGTEQISLIPKSAADVGAVPTTRTVNGKALSSNITLSASDVGARASTWVPSASDITSGTLSSNRLPTVPITKGGTGATTAAGALINLGITATAAELNKLDGVTATTAELNYVDGVTSNIQTQLNAKVPTSRTVNGKALSSNISLGAVDVGALQQQCTYYGSSSTVNIDTCNDSFALFDSTLVGSTLKKLLGNPSFIYIFTFFYFDPNYKLQIAFPYNLAGPAVAVRQSNGGTWKAWTRIDNHAPLTNDQYGTTLPAAGTAGRLFFKKVT